MTIAEVSSHSFSFSLCLRLGNKGLKKGLEDWTYPKLRGQVVGISLVDLLPTGQGVRELVMIRLMYTLF